MVKKKRGSDKLDTLKKKLQLEQGIIDNQLSENEKKLKLLGKTGREPDVKEDIDEQVREVVEMAKERFSTTDASTIPTTKNFDKKIEIYAKLFADVKKEIAKIIVGQNDAVEGLLRALIANGHVLLEGVPGIAKTALIRTLAKTTGCSFSRIQFTPDLLPTDIIGISTYQEGRGFYTLKGPIFNNFILADEINRAPPKVQSALLECMAEKQATIAKESFPVPLPFFTMATQNPLESVGTYALPEAQIDRFLFKVYMDYPNIEEEQKILRSNISVEAFDNFEVKSILNPDLIVQIQEDVKKVYVDKKVERYIVQLVDATRIPKKYGISLGKYVQFGASPRGSIGLFTSARAEALLNGQGYVTPHMVKKVAFDVLRHRLILSYEGQAEGIRTEQVITEILKKVRVP